MKYIFALLLLVVFACAEQEVQPHQYSFYYWRTTLELNQEEHQVLQTAPHNRVYVRYFGIDKTNQQIQPIALARKEESFKTDKEVVPVIYITNKTLLNITKQERKQLAKSIVQLANKKNEAFGFQPFKELQIDCDWTKGTRNDYFELLKELQEETKAKLSVTLRLHQVKYQQATGIPPVDKVYLMCYSTSSPLKQSSKNSILELNILKDYLANLHQYPIKQIEVALPIYSWGIVQNHLGKHQLINGLTKQDLKQKGLELQTEYKAVVTEDGFYFGFFLNKGFVIKVEEVQEETLNEAVTFLNTKLKNYNIVYYQLNHKFINNQTFTR